MKKYAIVLLVAIFALLSSGGCSLLPVSAPTVALESPANGSSVSSLTPILAWNCNETGVSYRVQVATDGNFQNLVIDQSALPSPSYTVPSGRLSDNQTYYWRVNGSKGGKISEWTPYWSFQTSSGAAAGTIMVRATLNGASWSGAVNYALSGAKTDSGSSVPQTFSNFPTGSYTLSFSSGGPGGATLANITPSATQNLAANGSITFTLNFQTQAGSSIMVNATFDGNPWTGGAHYSISGPYTDSLASVPQTFNNLSPGTYTVTFRSGGPGGATMAEITPSPTQTLSAGGALTFTLHFHSRTSSTIRVNATLDGVSWRGNMNYTINGPYDDSSSYVPDNFGGLPAGTYTIHYRSGGPAGATMGGISPGSSQTLNPGSTVVFTFNFYSQSSSTIMINAALDGASWRGNISYTVSGPCTDSSSYVPDNFSGLPAGTYTIHYRSGGPAGATLGSISPSPSQSVGPNEAIRFTFNFHSQASSTIRVNATLDGRTWETCPGSGTINYGIEGPYSDSSSTMPDTFRNVPAGTYSLVYRSGGPTGASLGGISPSSRQNVRAGQTITFTLNFYSQAKGTVIVNATLNGHPWQGSVRYTLAGPYVDSASSVPKSFDNCPQGAYTLSYSSGGPPNSMLESITPSPHQNLSPGGTITFTLNFVSGLLK